MKFFGLPLAILTALQLQYAAADMYIYQSQDTMSGTGADIYNFFTGHPSCNDVNSATNYMGRDDVSGRRSGVNCDGSGCWNGNPNDITRLEMNTKFGHMTIYKDRGWKMYDGDRVMGYCKASRDDDFLCGPWGRSGFMLFYCQTSVM
ncbi:hypothetical protein C8A01DRAFT_15676 [Parachaetomium inaequale]|uniref:Uncharacterized protein n=1 Tax=Parachaetomium inaequale TaxID=2588326 RepID=A0AAN6PG70_9PEZI|nr:hypothetical protein C8A01DRAFT_15676 [Parachaetomium inaequale]